MASIAAQYFRKQASSFRNDTRGAIHIMFAGSIFCLCLCLGVAIDFGTSYRIKQELNAAADAAGLSVVSASSPTFQAAAAMTSDGDVPGGAAAAVKTFDAAIVNQDEGLEPPTVTATVVKTGPTITATINFDGKVHTHFLYVLGTRTIPVSGYSVSTNGTPVFIDFHMLLDNSPSMGIGATPGDVQTMVDNTPDQCGFACHVASCVNGGCVGGLTYYDIAHNLGVKTRIDSLRDATTQLVSTALDTENQVGVPNLYRMSVDTFNTGVTNVVPLTNDMSAHGAAASAAQNIDLMITPFQGSNDDRYTNIEAALSHATANIPVSDSGVDANHPQRVLFLVTDGVGDQNLHNAANIVSDAHSIPDPNRLIQSIDETECQALKDNGVKIAVVYTTYTELPTNQYWRDNVKPWQDNINPHAKACASPGYFIEIAPGQDISKALSDFFKKFVAEARVTS